VNYWSKIAEMKGEIKKSSPIIKKMMKKM